MYDDPDDEPPQFVQDNWPEGCSNCNALPQDISWSLETGYCCMVCGSMKFDRKVDEMIQPGSVRDRRSFPSIIMRFAWSLVAVAWGVMFVIIAAVIAVAMIVWAFQVALDTIS